MLKDVKLSADVVHEAKVLYWTGWTIQQIADTFKIPYGTLDSRKRREKWDKATSIERAKHCVDFRYNQLLIKPSKTNLEIKELNALGRELERLDRRETYQQTKKDSDLNPNLKKRNEGKAAKKNRLTYDQIVKLLDDFYDHLFDYQKEWLEAKKHRTRNILKSRQIGATWYFAREAFIDAVETGDNQIFLSASNKQAQVFKAYIVQWVKDITGVELRGDPMVLPNGATLYFLSTNVRTAQSYHGHIYMDEYFWIPRFQEFNKVASGMAMHKKWRKTYISTPSTLNHEAYPFWNGKHYNKGRPKAEHIELDISHKALKDGSLGEDGQWRQMVTVLDAVEKGCSLFEIDDLRREYSPDDFENLLMCKFVDDALSVFKFNDLRKCGVDSLEKWQDYKRFFERPFRDQEVWLGYDPSRTRDDASLVVIAPPSVPGGKYRVLEKFSWNNTHFEEQARQIKEITTRYNVTKIAIDASGIGAGVYELVEKFYPAAIKITYSLEVKTRLVLKMMQIVNRRQIEWDAGDTEIPLAFMTIKKTITPSGGHTTFKASRTEATGHADVAWAIMHAFEGEAMMSVEGTVETTQTSIMELM